MAVSEMMDKKTLKKHREELLDGLAAVVNEVAPTDYAPEGTDAVEKEMFAFGGAPQMDLARAASEVQRETYENSALRQLMRPCFRRSTAKSLEVSMASSSKGCETRHDS